MRRILVVLSLAMMTGRGAWAIDVTACGTNVPPGEIADLQVDLDCTAAVPRCVDAPAVTCTTDRDCPAAIGACVRYGVRLDNYATLRLNGHALNGGGVGDSNTPVGVLCRGRDCVVDGGGGSIGGHPFAGIWHWGKGRMTVSDTTIHDTSWAIVTAYFARRLIVSNVTVHDAVGIAAEDVEATDLTLVNSGGGCGFGGAALHGRKIRGTNVTASFVDAERRLEVTGLTVAADCGWGVVVRKGATRLTDATITGASAVDVVTARPPLFTNVTCGSSRRYDRQTEGASTETWGVCAND